MAIQRTAASISVNTASPREPKHYTVVHLKLDTGENLPTLVEKTTWLPARVATRWAVRKRRDEVAVSTLIGNLRTLGRIYEYAWNQLGLDLDDYVLSGGTFNEPEDRIKLDALLTTLRVRGEPSIRVVITADDPEDLAALEDLEVEDRSILAAAHFDRQLWTVQNFLVWALDPANRGGTITLRGTEITEQKTLLTDFFESKPIGAKESTRILPLTNDELLKLKRAIGPVYDPFGKIKFPVRFETEAWDPRTRLRNWLMICVGLELGLRRGEILKLRLDSLPRGKDDRIAVRRWTDDPQDRRKNPPAVKTAERMLPISKSLTNLFNAYIAGPPPARRVGGRTPYLFTSAAGNELSARSADKVIQMAGEYAGIDLSWHRLRHTWAEDTAADLVDSKDPLATDKLKYLGGWDSDQMPRHYIQNTMNRAAEDFLRKRHVALYGEDECLPY